MSSIVKQYKEYLQFFKCPLDIIFAVRMNKHVVLEATSFGTSFFPHPAAVGVALPVPDLLEKRK